MKPVRIVAEIGCNHQGDFMVAKRMISIAAACGVDYVKFQKRSPKECLTPERYGESYHSEHSYGRTYGEHREKLEFPIDAHHELKAFAESLGVGYACSVWDITSLREIISLDPDYLKIPSAHNEDFALIRKAVASWKKPLHISNGMATPQTETAWVKLGLEWRRKIVPYVCTSTYPNKMGDVNLTDGLRLQESFGFDEFGFSGHHLGIALDIAAVSLGAAWVERHFTLDRTMKGRDQSASLEPDALRKLVRDIQAVQVAWKDRIGVMDCEQSELPRKVRTA